MTTLQQALAARRALLVTKSARQREDLTQELEAWQARAVSIDRWWAAIYRYRLMVAVAAGFTAVVGLRKRRALMTWLRRGWFAWGLLRSLRAMRS
jgi:hypothetical protein